MYDAVARPVRGPEGGDVRRTWLSMIPALLLCLGCPEEDLCDGAGPYDEPCTCADPERSDAVEGYPDHDGDGFGVAGKAWFCGGGHASNDADCDDTDAALNGSDRDADGVTTCDGDCDDGDALTAPGLDEVCDGADNDCDGEAPGEVDEDGDGHLVCAGDCDDTDPYVTPEDLDGDGVAGCDDPPDCDDSDADLHLDDADGDGVSPCDGDCDDSDAAMNLDDLDGDGSSPCGGDCDDADPSVDGNDVDGDGYSTCDGDCDDEDEELSPEDFDMDGYSTCDGDCHDFNDGLSPADEDGDGVSTCDGDCDDSDAASAPGLDEVCDGADNDCDGDVPEDETEDLDGDLYVACEDCDDSDPAQYPDDSITSGWARACGYLVAPDPSGSAWYGHRIEQPGVVEDGTMLAVYFRTGYAADELAIGMVWTDDGATWQLEGAPVLNGDAAPDAWDTDGVSHPAPVYDPSDVANPYKLYYAAVDPGTGGTSIGLAVSSDGFTWERYTEPDPPHHAVQVVTHGGLDDLDEFSASDPFVWLEGPQYHMLYRCSDGVDSGICLATSTDGYEWTKWDPEPLAGYDPQPLLLNGETGAWDEAAIGSPVLVQSATAATLVYAGHAGGGASVGGAHMPFEHDGELARLDDLAPLYEPGMSGRWDDLSVTAGGTYEDEGQWWLFHDGATEDASVDGGEVVGLGIATGEGPALTLTAPVDPQVITAADEVTFTGAVTDSDALDELYVVLSSELDSGILLTTLADAAGDFSIVAPAGTFVEGGPYLVTVTVYDAGGLADAASVSFEVTP